MYPHTTAHMYRHAHVHIHVVVQIYALTHTTTHTFVYGRTLCCILTHTYLCSLCSAYIHTQEAIDGRVMMKDIHTPMCSLHHMYVQTYTHISGRFMALPSALPLHTNTSSWVLEICLMMIHTYTHPYPCPPLIACTNTFLLHVYRSVFIARNRHYTQLAYLFHRCATSLLGRDGRIADYCETSRRGSPVF